MGAIRHIWRHRIVLAAFACAWVAGCASYHTPEGTDAATLTCAAKILKIYQVDGDRTWSWHHQSDGLGEVRLAPGKHTIAAHVFLGDYYAECSLWFVAAPTGKYHLQYQWDGKYVQFWVVDDATDRPVGGFTGSDDEPPDAGTPVENDLEIERLDDRTA